MSYPMELRGLQESLYAGDTTALSDSSVRNMFLPLDVGNLSQTVHMELPYVAPVECPSFATIEERCQYHSSINSYLCFKGDAMVAPQMFP